MSEPSVTVSSSIHVKVNKVVKILKRRARGGSEREPPQPFALSQPLRSDREASKPARLATAYAPSNSFGLLKKQKMHHGSTRSYALLARAAPWRIPNATSRSSDSCSWRQSVAARAAACTQEGRRQSSHHWMVPVAWRQAWREIR